MGKKAEDGKKIFFKALANTFWLIPKSCFWFNKVVNGQPSIKWTSWKGNAVTKTRWNVQFVKKIPLEMFIGQQMKEEGHDQNS